MFDIKTAISLLEILYDGQAHLISKLCEQLNCSTIYLQNIKTDLCKQEIPILEAHDSYQLIIQVPPLNGDFLRSALYPHQIFISSAIDSTNQFLLEKSRSLNKGDICLSEYQFHGRGRRGRRWLNIYSGQINMSVYWVLEQFSQTEGLSLIVGLAIADALHSMGYAKINLKWPNDILLLGRKLGGILIEVSFKTNVSVGLVIGIGINLVLPESWQQYHCQWAALSESDIPTNKNQLIVTFFDYLQEYLKIFEKKSFAVFRQRWLQYDYYLGKKVRLVTTHEVALGLEQGVKEDGSITILTAQGLRYFQGGELSLLKA